ncbi:MAG: PhnD/SsuA/transferrin family substrate-binding protein [Methylovulum sp.]|nr:PhnD/SsuA/transferrin family substrate-binding protein [Methylovulum sp.]
MPYQFTVSPDFSPEHLPGWYIFNTWLQRRSNEAIHLELYDSFQKLGSAIEADQVDLIYANPFDAAVLVRKKGFLPLVKAAGVSDEAIIAVHGDYPALDIGDLSSGIKVALPEAPDVSMIGMMLLEAGDLNAGNIRALMCDSYILIAKQLLQGNVDVGVFFAEAYDDLSNITKSKLKVLVRSQISVIHHTLMIGPKLASRRDDIQHSLVTMNQDEKGKHVVKSLGFDAWVTVEDEEMEFMIDLMDALAI